MLRIIPIVLLFISTTTLTAPAAPAPSRARTPESASTRVPRTPGQAPAHATPQVLGRAGEATLQKLQSSPASWTKRMRLATGRSDVVASVVQAPGLRRVTLTITAADGRPLEVLRLVELDGFWYVRTELGAGKYKPYSVPFAYPGMMMFIELADVQMMTSAATPEEFGRFAGVEGQTATYYNPAPPGAREQAANMVAEMEKKIAEHPDLVTPDIERNLANTKKILTEGTPRKIDIATGIIMSTVTPQLSLVTEDFKFLPEIPDAEFDVAGTNWRDQSADLHEIGDPNDLVMFGYNGGWTFRSNSNEMDGVLLNIKTGALRRIPFRGVSSLPGCFLPDRSKVVVAGVDLFGGVLACYLVDLKTGETSHLGGEACATGITLGPAISPDGKTIAVYHKAPEDKILEGKIVLIDLATGEGRPIGESADQAFISWLPDSSGLVVVRRTHPGGLRDQTVKRIHRMDLNGKVTPIRTGDRPLALRDGRIMFFDDDDRWYTCKVDGTDTKLLRDGLPNCHFPTISPDGKRLIMMRTRIEQQLPPAPVVIDLSDGSMTPVSVGPGLWGMPQW